MKPQMPEPFTIEKLVPLMDQAGVDRAVIVPPSWPGDRNDYGLEAAKRYPNRFARDGAHSSEESASGGAAAEVEGAAGHAWRARDVPRPGPGVADRRHAGLVLAGGRKGRPAGDVSDRWPQRRACPRCRAPSGAAADRRSHGRRRRHHQAGPARRGDRADRFARQISERVGQAFGGAELFCGGLSVPRFDAAHPSSCSTPMVRSDAIGAPT